MDRFIPEKRSEERARKSSAELKMPTKKTTRARRAFDFSACKERRKSQKQRQTERERGNFGCRYRRTTRPLERVYTRHVERSTSIKARVYTDRFCRILSAVFAEVIGPRTSFVRDIAVH